MNCYARKSIVLAALVASLVIPVSAAAHHFKGLPHYSYFENYPQVPTEEFLGQDGEYEYSLVLYDFQGLTKEDLYQPDNARLYLIIFNLRANKVYDGPLILSILDRDDPFYEEDFEGPAEECVYAIQHELPDTGRYSLRVTLGEEPGGTVLIPFRLSSQRTNWGKGVAGILVALVAVVAVGSRRARVKQDRRAAARAGKGKGK